MRLMYLRCLDICTEQHNCARNGFRSPSAHSLGLVLVGYAPFQPIWEGQLAVGEINDQLGLFWLNMINPITNGEWLHFWLWNCFVTASVLPQFVPLNTVVSDQASPLTCANLPASLVMN